MHWLAFTLRYAGPVVFASFFIFCVWCFTASTKLFCARVLFSSFETALLVYPSFISLMVFRNPRYALATDWDRSHKEARCRRSHGSAGWCPELECCRGADWIPTPEREPSASLIVLAPGYRRVAVVPDTVMRRKYVEWFTAWKAEYPHCSLLVYDIEIVPRDDLLMTATTPVVERSIFDDGRPPVLQQIFQVSDDNLATRTFHRINVPQWGCFMRP